MTPHNNPYVDLSNGSTEPRNEENGAQSLEQLFAGTRELFVQTTGQLRGISELAFMELDLAISSFHWWVWTLVLFSVSSVMTFTLIIAAALLAFTENAISPSAVMLIMGGLSALVASGLFLCLKALSKKMTFNTLRAQLTQPQADDHVKTRQ